MGTTQRMSSRLRRCIALALVLGLFGAAAGAWAGQRRDDSHRATAVVLVNPLQGNPFSPDSREGLLNLETEARLVVSDAVARGVVDDLADGSSVADVVAAVSVEVPVNTQLLRVTGESRDPDRATLLADSFARHYLDYRSARTASSVFDRRAHLSEELRSMQSELQLLTAQRETKPVGSPRRAVLDQQVAALVAQVAQVQSEQTALGYVSQDPGQIVTPAQTSGAGPLPAAALFGGAGGALGVVLAIALVLGRGQRDANVGSVVDLVAAEHDVVGLAAEAEAIRARVLVARPERPLVVLVGGVGVRPEEVALSNLVDSFGRSRLHTAHIELHPEAAEQVQEGARPRFDLVDVLLGDATVDKALVRIDDFLSKVRVGRDRDPADLLASPELGTVVAELRERYDVVVFSGLLLPGAEAQLLLGHADVALLWTTARASTYSALDEAERLVDVSSATLVGIAHDIPAKRRKHLQVPK